MKEIDARGLSCPEPVLRAQRGMEKLGVGETLLVRVDTTSARDSVERAARKLGLSVVIEETDKHYQLRVSHG